MGIAHAYRDSTQEFQEVTQRLLLQVASAGNASACAKVAALIERQPHYPSAALAAAAPLPNDGNPYSRKVIFSSDFGEAMIAHWRAGAVCHPHDHGKAGGVVVALKGSFFEQAFSLVGGFKKVGDEIAFPLAALHQVKPGEIHSMRAAEPGITLHLYTPSTKGMKIYDEASRTIFTVAEDCGAWIPSNPSSILKSEPLDCSSLYN